MKLMALKKELKNIKDLEGHTFPSLGAELSHLEKDLVKKASDFQDLKKICRENHSNLKFLKSLFSSDENAHRGLAASDVQQICAVSSDSGGVVIKLGDFSILIKNGYGDRETSCYLITRDANACHYMRYELYFKVGEGALILKTDNFAGAEAAAELPAGTYQTFSFRGNIYFLKTE